MDRNDAIAEVRRMLDEAGVAHCHLSDDDLVLQSWKTCMNIASSFQAIAATMRQNDRVIREAFQVYLQRN